jgi:hypothetical protein
LCRRPNLKVVNADMKDVTEQFIGLLHISSRYENQDR